MIGENAILDLRVDGGVRDGKEKGNEMRVKNKGLCRQFQETWEMLFWRLLALRSTERAKMRK